MAYNLTSLISTVRKRAKDSSFDADLITEYLQEVHDEVLSRSRFPFMEVSDTDTVLAGSTEYDLSDEVDVVVSLELVDDSNRAVKPRYLGYQEFYDRYEPDVASAATPCHYTIFASTIVWQAPLDRAYTMNIRYIKTPTALEASTEPDIPERFKAILINGALQRVAEYRGNYDIAALHERKVEELTEDMLGRLSLRQVASNHKARFGRR